MRSSRGQRKAYVSKMNNHFDSAPVPHTAVLLAAGRGSRLRPHTDTVPKPLLPWNGEPALGAILDSVSASGISCVVLVTRYLSEQIDTFVQQQKHRWPVQIICVEQPTLSGTADAVLSAVDQIPTWFEHDFLVSATDYLVEPSFYPEFVQFHQQHGQPLSVSLKSLPREQLAGRSSVRLTHGFDIAEIVEKPEAGQEPSTYSANLLFILPESIVHYLRGVNASPRGEKEIQSAINEWIHANQAGKGLLQKTPTEWSPELDQD